MEHRHSVMAYTRGAVIIFLISSFFGLILGVSLVKSFLLMYIMAWIIRLFDNYNRD